MEALNKFMKPRIGMIIVGAVFLLIGILCVITVFSWPVLFIVAFGGIILAVGISEQKKYKDYIQQLTDSGEINQVIADFNGGRQMIKGALILGNTYLIGKGQGQVVRYTDICQIYQHVTRRNFVESSRKLVYVGPDGKPHDLVDLPLRDKAKDEVIQIMVIVQSKNPNVKLGYN